MIIFKTTFHLEPEVHDEALRFIKTEYIRKAMVGGMLYDPQMSRIIVCYNDEAGASYNLLFRVKDRETLNKWTEQIGGALQEELVNRFGDKVSCFVTLKRRILLEAEAE